MQQFPPSPQRPLGVTLVALLLTLIGVFLIGVTLARMFSPGLVLPIRHTAVLRTMGLVNSYFAILAGVVWILIAWGLFTLHGFARMAAMILIFMGVGFDVGLLVMGAPGFSRFPLWITASILVRLIIVWYLFRSPVAEKFQKLDGTA
jgi:hypothetical protein